MQLHNSLLHLILEKSYREGDFTLASGAKSKFYIDLKPTILHPEGARLLGKLAVEWIQNNKLNFDGVGGLTLGADPIVMAVSLAAHDKGMVLPATMIRKEPKKHGTSRYIEGVENFKKRCKIPRGRRCGDDGRISKKSSRDFKTRGLQPHAHFFPR